MFAGLVTSVALQRRENRRLREAIVQTEKNISIKVEERLINHTKYCDGLDALVRERLEKEYEKWAELIEAAKCQVKETVENVTLEGKKMLTLTKKEIVSSLERVDEEVNKKLEKQKVDFKGLLDAAYLEQYEKMRRNPPRPKKGPRKKIDPPSRYRSLDDEFCSVPPPTDSAE